MDLSKHAQRRSQQRSISESEIQAALDWGTPIRQRHGRTAYHLGRRDVRRARQRGALLPQGAQNVTAILSQDGTLVTVVRSPNRRRLRRSGW